MLAIITGASSGIGRDIARELSRRGYDLILVARREERLRELQQDLKTNSDVFAADLTKESECQRLCDYVTDKKWISLLITRDLVFMEHLKKQNFCGSKT